MDQLGSISNQQWPITNIVVSAQVAIQVAAARFHQQGLQNGQLTMIEDIIVALSPEAGGARVNPGNQAMSGIVMEGSPAKHRDRGQGRHEHVVDKVMDPRIRWQVMDPRIHL